LTGLPDREALGLNVIESVPVRTPVLRVDAPPFTETMRDGITGFLYTDPRQDRGRHFAQLRQALPTEPAARSRKRPRISSLLFRTSRIASTRPCKRCCWGPAVAE
jgi:hypothetical protein